MTILDNSRCKTCKKEKNSKSIVLSKILPEVIANNILSYDCCNYCGKLRAKEQENKSNEHLSKIEKHILYFKRTRLSRFNAYNGSILVEMNQIKEIIDDGYSPSRNF